MAQMSGKRDQEGEKSADSLHPRTVIFENRSYRNCFTGSELVDWIRKRDVTRGTDASQAVAIAQGLLDEGFIDFALDEEAIEATGKYSVRT